MSDSEIKTKSSLPAFAAWLGLTSAVATLVLFLTIRWEWSFLMDEVDYARRIPNEPHFWPALFEYGRTLWFDGRFRPLHYFANFVQFTYLPLNPALFRVVDLGVLCISLGLGGAAVLRATGGRIGRGYLSAIVFIFSFIGLGFLHRPLLDTVALSSIPETWMILFLGIGAFLLAHRSIGYRLFFLLAALSKEPGILIFLCSALSHLLPRLRGQPLGKKQWAGFALDAMIFLLLALVVRMAMKSGLYLSNYSLLEWANLPMYALGLFKVALGLLPFVIFLPHAKRLWPALRGRPELERFVFLWAAFGLSYLCLVVPRGVAGYLLVPISFSLVLAASAAAITVWDAGAPLGRHSAILAGSLALLMLTQSLVRFGIYANAINETTRTFRLLLLTHHPRVIMINGEEATMLGRVLAQEAGTGVRVEFLSSALVDSLPKCGTEVVLLELSRYFSPVSEGDLKSIGERIGGWIGHSDGGLYRVFYGGNPKRCEKSS